VRRRPCLVTYREADGTQREETTTIVDVFARQGGEYARLGTGAVVRLDRLGRVEPVDASASVDTDGGASS
jgi:hypothetical protein